MTLLPDKEIGNALRHYRETSKERARALDSAIRDLTGSDERIRAPLLHLTQHQAFILLNPDADSPGTKILSRDAILSDLEEVYNPRIIGRLRDVLNGFLRIQEETETEGVAIESEPPKPSKAQISTTTDSRLEIIAIAAQESNDCSLARTQELTTQETFLHSQDIGTIATSTDNRLNSPDEASTKNHKPGNREKGVSSRFRHFFERFQDGESDQNDDSESPLLLRSTLRTMQMEPIEPGKYSTLKAGCLVIALLGSTPLILISIGFIAAPRAISHYSNRLSANPRDAEAYLNRGHARALLGDRANACKDWHSAATLGNIYATTKFRYDCNFSKVEN